jgi:hypothetical protein
MIALAYFHRFERLERLKRLERLEPFNVVFCGSAVAPHEILKTPLLKLL